MGFLKTIQDSGIPIVYFFSQQHVGYALVQNQHSPTLLNTLGVASVQSPPSPISTPAPGTPSSQKKRLFQPADYITQDKKPLPPGDWTVVFLGTGPSSAVPKLGCILHKSTKCVCNAPDPRGVNHRLNPSLLLQRRSLIHSAPEGNLNFVVDVGKTFRESVIKSFKQNHVQYIDGVVITHSHSDAFHGLDDLREVQFRKTRCPIYADAETGECVKEVFPYLFPSPGEGSGMYTAACDLHSITPFVPFYLGDLEVIGIPMWHGSTTCLGFAFSHASFQNQFVYLSDFRFRSSQPADQVQKNCPAILEEDFTSLNVFVDIEKSIQVLKSKTITTLVLDALMWDNTHFSHSNRQESIRFIHVLKSHGIVARQVYFTGMGCSIDYDHATATLNQEFGGKVLPGYDGLRCVL